MTSTNTSKISTAVLFGLIAGAAMMLFDLGTYLSGPATFVGPVVYLVYLVLVGIAVAAAMRKKRQNGGFLSFQEGLKCCFTVFVMGLALHVFFIWLLTNVIDTNFKAKLPGVIAANAEEAFRRFGMPEDQIRQTLEAQKKEDPFSLGSLVKGLAYYYIVFFLISLLIAAVVKRKKA
ncbi:MAG: DUF4199 domain-containing protein [Bacteroidetes bacterium]|nr:DUF4199 domain-containing protein [Bacteroidota bacterium]